MARQRKRVPLRASCLFRITSKRRLADVLKTTCENIDAISSKNNNYLEWNQKGRWIEEPKHALKKIQIRFADLLAQIETPPYLHSGVKGRSYLSNARTHSAETHTAKIDIKKFYRSARAQQVFHFFLEDLEWPSDLAGIATALLTHNGHLPTGGNASPILSFWSYRSMFDEISELAARDGCVFSLYIDDMAVSGDAATRKIVFDARTIVGSRNLEVHKIKTFAPLQSRVITGAALTPAGVKVPRRRQLKIAEAEQAVADAQTKEDKLARFKSLIGRLCEAAEVDPAGWSSRAKRSIRQQRELAGGK